jgi:hypothetical protein
MDTLKDKQILDDAVERGDVPWQLIDRAYAEAAE